VSLSDIFLLLRKQRKSKVLKLSFLVAIGQVRSCQIFADFMEEGEVNAYICIYVAAILKVC
jgi:hypothetical protein